MDNIFSMKTVTHTSQCAQKLHKFPHSPPYAFNHSCKKSQLGCGAEVGWGVISAKLHMIWMIWCNFFFFLNPAVTLSLKLVEGSPVCIRDDMSEGYTQKAGGWVQPLVDKGPGRGYKTAGFRLHYHGWQLALWTAPWQLRTEKENGAETKSSASIWPLSAAEFAVMARKCCRIEACKMNTTSGPFDTTQQASKTRDANGHLRPLFWTIAAREVRRGDLVSGTPFLSFGN